MNKLTLNISVNFYHETITAIEMAKQLANLGLLETIESCITTNPKAISVGAFTEEAEDTLCNLYSDTNINLWADNDV